MEQIEWNAIYNEKNCIYEKHICAFLSEEEKQQLKEVIQESHFQFIDEKALKKVFLSLPEYISSKESLYSYLTTIPLHTLLSKELNLNSFFVCYFFEGYYAWISHNHTHHYRYFTKAEGEKTIAMDLIDLLQLQYNVTKEELYPFLLCKFQLALKILSWKDSQILKYKENQSFPIHSYKNLSLLLKDQFTYLIQFNNYAIQFVKSSMHVEGEHIFFASSSQLSELFNISSSKVNKCLNLFATIGLIEKIPIQKLPHSLKNQAIKIKQSTKKKNIVNFFAIPRFSEVICEAEKNAEILMQNGIRYSNLSKSVVAKLFGEERAVTIYPQTIQKNKNKRHRQRESIDYCLEANFIRLLESKGYVTKSMLADEPMPDLSKEKTMQYINLSWSHFLKKHQCMYKRPTKEMKQQWQLQTNEYVAYKGGV